MVILFIFSLRSEAQMHREARQEEKGRKNGKRGKKEGREEGRKKKRPANQINNPGVWPCCYPLVVER